MMQKQALTTHFKNGGVLDGVKVSCGEPPWPGYYVGASRTTSRDFVFTSPPSISAQSIYRSEGVKGTELELVHVPRTQVPRGAFR